MTHEASFAHRSDLSALIVQPSSTADGVERHVDTASISNLQGDPELDFLSARFNAEKALATPGLQPPVPDEAPYDNVAAFRKHLPADIPDSLSNMPHVPRNEASLSKHLGLKETAARFVQRIEDSATASLQKVLDHVQPGPMQILQVWFAAKRRVKVITRHARGVRGVAVGFLTAYDRFMNVVLRDVKESYTVLVKVPCYRKPKPPNSSAPATDSSHTQSLVDPPSGGTCKGRLLDNQDPGLLEEQKAQPAQEVVRWIRKQEHRQRQLGQIFIKGDSIVSVSYMPHL